MDPSTSQIARSHRNFFPIAICLLAFVASSVSARTFTATDGRTIEATVVGMKENSAVLKRSDGPEVTVPLTLLSEADREYLKQWSIENAKNKIPRVKVVVDSNKRDSAVQAGYDQRRGSFQFKISITNEERGFRLEKGTATLVVLGDYRYNPGEQVVMQRREFKDISIDFGKTYEINAEEVRYEYYREFNSGQKYSDYVFVFRNAAGKVIDVSGSNTRIENLADIILRLKEEDHCNKRYQKIKTSSSGTSSILR